MKKNTMMRFASVLLVAVLLTTCVISGTFAKYIESGNYDGSEAKVALWGVDVTVTANGDFTQTYATDLDPAAQDSTPEDIETVVSAGYKTLAPGTEGNLATITITGTPEVAVNVKTEATLTLENWTVGGADYCPIVFTVGTVNYLIGTEADTPTMVYCDDVADLIATVEGALEVDVNYAPNTPLADTNNRTISWAWAFETGADDDAKAANNVKDTALGNANAATIQLDLTTTVTQID